MDWQGGIGTIQERTKYLWETGHEWDVEFLVGNEEAMGEEKQLFKAHKFVLSISSCVFATQFRVDNSLGNAKPIEVKDISASAFKAMLNFIYTNDLSLIDKENYLDVYSAAKKYWLKAFAEKCAELAKTMLHLDNVIGVWRMAKLQEDNALIEHCLDFFDGHFDDFNYERDNSDFLTLTHAEYGELLTRDTLTVEEELFLFNDLETWAEKQCANAGIKEPNGVQMRDAIGPLLFEIRFPLIPYRDFVRNIVPTAILNAEEIAAMFIHYSENSDDDLKEEYPLPFSSCHRKFTRPNYWDGSPCMAAPPPGYYD